MIGTALSEYLRSKGHKVAGVDIKPPQHPDDFEFDLREKLTKNDIGARADVVIHLAAHASVSKIEYEPLKAAENLKMTITALEMAKELKAKFILASSREVYGAVEDLTDEDFYDPDNIYTKYGISKRASEEMAYSYQNDVDIAILRLSNVYGRYDFSSRLIPQLIKHALSGTEATVIPHHVVDLVYIDDVCKAFELAITHPNFPDVTNVASGNSYNIREVIEILNYYMGFRPLKYKEVNQFEYPEISSFFADISLLKRFGFIPTPLKDGLLKAIEYYKNATQS